MKGLKVAAHGDKLLVAPRGVLDPDLRLLLVRHKAEILAVNASAGGVIAKKVSTVSVSGLGDEAYYAPELYLLSFIAKGDVYSVSVSGSHDDKAAAIAVAKVVLTHAG